MNFSITAFKKYLTEEDEEDGVVAKEAPRKLPNVGDRVEVFRSKDEKYYPGIKNAVNPETTNRHIDFGDGDKEILDFSKEKLRIIQIADGNGNYTINKDLNLIKQKSSKTLYSSSV